MHIIGFFISVALFAFLGSLIGEGGIYGGMVVGALFIICAQLGEIIRLMKN
ncbi:MAG: hypothetical protein AB2421_10250 [Thermotaleaceae bacterium]